MRDGEDDLFDDAGGGVQDGVEQQARDTRSPRARSLSPVRDTSISTSYGSAFVEKFPKVKLQFEKVTA